MKTKFFEIARLLYCEMEGKDYSVVSGTQEQTKDKYAQIEEYRNKGCVTQNELLVGKGQYPVYGGDDIWFDVD